MSNLKAGIGRVDFTPPAGLPLMGNLRDDYASRGVHDPLFSRAVVFENSTGQKAVLLTLDICLIGKPSGRVVTRIHREARNTKKDRVKNLSLQPSGN